MVRRAAQVLGLVLFLAVLLFVSAGTLDWPWAWVFLGLYLAGIAVNSVLLLRRSPETIVRRSESAGQVGWDRVVGGLWTAAGLVCIPIAAGLEWRLTRGAGVSLAWHGLGAACFVAGLALFSWAHLHLRRSAGASVISNAFFATVVRVQRERGHRVCSDGPYR